MHTSSGWIKGKKVQEALPIESCHYTHTETERWGVVNPVWCLSTLNGSQRLYINELGQQCVTHELQQHRRGWKGIMDVTEKDQP